MAIDLSAQLEKLKAARSGGVLLVQHGDTRVQYRSLTEINAAIAAIEAEIAAAGGASVVRRFKFTTCKDL